MPRAGRSYGTKPQSGKAQANALRSLVLNARDEMLAIYARDGLPASYAGVKGAAEMVADEVRRRADG